MALNNPYETYQQNAILTARPEELTLMLYNGAIKFLKQAKNSIEDKKVESAHNYILKAEDIILELMSSLDMSYEISNNLYSLYEFMNNWLVQANMHKDKEGIKKIDEVLNLLEELRSTWVEAMKLAKISQKSG